MISAQATSAQTEARNPEPGLLWLRSRARGSRLAPGAGISGTLLDGTALAALLRALEARGARGAVLDDAPATTAAARGNLGACLKLLRMGAPLDDAFYRDNRFADGARLYGALAAADGAGERLLYAVFRAYVRPRLRLEAARVATWFDGVLRPYGLGLAARGIAPEDPRDAWASALPRAFADGARLRTALYHFAGANGVSRRRAGALGRAALAAADASQATSPQPIKTSEELRAARSAHAAALEDVLAVGRELGCPALFASGGQWFDALVGTSSHAMADDFALLQLRDLRDCLRARAPRGSPADLEGIREDPRALEELAAGGQAEAPPPAAAPAAAPEPEPEPAPLRNLASPPWARVAA